MISPLVVDSGDTNDVRNRRINLCVPSNLSQAARITTQDERDGVQTMVAAIGEAYQRAKTRGSGDSVYHYMSLPRNYSSRLSMVTKLQESRRGLPTGDKVR